MDKILSKTTCIVVPAFNESAVIGSVVRRCKQLATTVYVVDDGSTDNTSSEAQGNGAEVMRLQSNMGLGYALRVGLKNAFSQGFETVVTTDGDGVHRMEDIISIEASHRRTRADLTLGSRAGSNQQFESLPDPKAASNTLVSLALNGIYNATVSDWLTGLRAFSRKVIDIDLQSDGFSISVEFILNALKYKWRITEIPITIDYGVDDLHATGRRELDSFLEYCIRMTSNTAFTLARESVSDGAKFRIAIEGNKFVCHPVLEYDSYIVQMERGQPTDVQSADWIQFSKDI